MSLLNIEHYDALRAAHVPETEAREAAKVTAEVETRMVTLAERLNGIDSKLTVVMWTMGIGLTLMIGGFASLFTAMWQILLRLPR